MPLAGGREDTATTGTSCEPSAASAWSRSARARRAASPRSALVTTSTSGTSMIPAFRNWSTSPEAGCTTTATVSQTSSTSVSDWPDPDRLDDDHVEGGRERVGGLAGGGGQAAEPAAGGRGADQDAVVLGVVIDPGAVAEQRAAGALGRRVDGEHGDRVARIAPRRDQSREQGGLPGPGRTGDPDEVRRRLAAERGGRDLHEQGPSGGPPAGRAILDQVQRRRRGGPIALAQAAPELCGIDGGHGRGTLAGEHGDGGGGDPAGIAHDLATREAERVEAGAPGALIAAAVGLEAVSAAVRGPAVDLDDQALLAPAR